MNKSKQNQVKSVLVIASLIFGLFFGAGNLIFPVGIGQASGESMFIANLGFIITAVGLPCLALYLCTRSDKTSFEAMLEVYGKRYARAFTIVLLLTLGPFFALPRTASVSYEVGIRSQYIGMNHQVGLLIFSGGFFLLALILALKPSKINKWVGVLINPIFLVMLLGLFVIVALKPMGNIANIPVSVPYDTNAFMTGFEEGYQTMDVLAALAYGFLVIRSIDAVAGPEKTKQRSRFIVTALLISGILMAIIYSVLTYMGASSLNILPKSPNGGIAMASIFQYYFGHMGGVFLTLVVSFACLKTAIALISTMGTYFSTTFKYLRYEVVVCFMAGFAFVISNIGLSAIVAYAVPVLKCLYPLAMMHVFLGLADARLDQKPLVAKITLWTTGIASACEFLLSMPNLSLPAWFVTLFTKQLPFASQGLSWLGFMIVGLVIGYGVHAWAGKSKQIAKSK